MDTGSGNADWADGAHGFVHLSLPRGGERESWAGVSMLKGRRAGPSESGGKWLELGGGWLCADPLCVHRKRG